MRLTKCLEFEKILDYLQDLLSISEKVNLENHLTECAECQVLVQEAQELLTFLREDASLTVAATTHKRAVALFEPWFRTAEHQVEAAPVGFIKWVATLIMDTRQSPGLVAPAMAGLRSAAIASAPYQMLYSLDDGRIEVDLQIQPGGQKNIRLLLGQVLGTTGTNCRVELVSADFSRRETTADETFTFRFTDVPVGIYLLNIYCDDQLFEIPVTSL